MRIERRGLPGLPDTYASFFYAVNDRLVRLKQQLGLSRINVDVSSAKHCDG